MKKKVKKLNKIFREVYPYDIRPKITRKRRLQEIEQIEDIRDIQPSY